MSKVIGIEKVKIGTGVAEINIGLKFDMMIGKGELKPFVEWLKSVGKESISVGETPPYLDHWREGKELGLY